MESRLLSILLRTILLSTLLAGGAVQAAEERQEQVIQPELDRRVYTEADIDTEDFEVGAFAGVLSIEDFGSNAIYGVRGAYHITEDFFVEASYGTSEAGETSYELLSGAARILTDDQRQYDYINLSIGWNIFPGEAFIWDRWAFNTAFYIVAGVGSTEFAGDSQFTINAGAGYRFLLTDFIALHFDVRDHIFDTDLLGEDKTTHNIEVSGGISVFF